MKPVFPVFIHSLFRSGSTYMFNVFRRSKEGYWCYQEPVHEIVLMAKEDPDKLLVDCDDAKMALLRHPKMEQSYFQELYEIYPKWKDFIKKEIIYDQYFDNQGDSRLRDYLSVLIEAAKGRPVIQECRTANRIAVIKKMFGGTHIYLWRNPWDQWWSYKINEYFDHKNLLILNADPCPAVIKTLRNIVGFEEFHSPDIFAEFSFFDQHRLSSENSYLLFYTLWCLGMLEGNSHADLLINIDALSDRPAYRQSKIEKLAELGITGVNFNDCRIVQTYYGEWDKAFFTKIEESVYGIFLSNGYSQEQLDTIIELRNHHVPLVWKMTPKQTDSALILENAVRARESVIKIETRESQRIQWNNARLTEAERNAAERAEEFEARLADVERKSLEHAAGLEARLTEAERNAAERTAELDARLMAAERKAAEHAAGLEAVLKRMSAFENELSEVESSISDLGAALSSVNSMVADVESQVSGLESRFESFEVSSRELKFRLEASDGVTKGLSERIQSLEARIQEMMYTRLQTQEQYNANIAELHEKMNALYNSISWRITKPLRTPPVRFVFRQFVRIREQGLVGRIRFVGGNITKMAAQGCISFIEGHSGLYDMALKVVHRLGLYDQARRLYRRYKDVSENDVAPINCYPKPHSMTNTELEQLSPRARKIYIQLKEAVEKQKNERNES